MINQLTSRLLLALLLLAPSISLAQTTTRATTSEPLIKSIDDAISKACGVVSLVFTGAIIITIIFVLLAGIKYIVHGSDPGKIAEAHKQLMWAAIGFAIALVARTMPFIIATVLGDPNLADPC